MDMNKIGQMSCNPAVRYCWGQIVREIDALGGHMGLVTDAAGDSVSYAEPIKDGLPFGVHRRDVTVVGYLGPLILDHTDNLDIFQVKPTVVEVREW